MKNSTMNSICYIPMPGIIYFYYEDLKQTTDACF